jgi:uncharacterized membrane protein YgaE (UPF0421/DUF939 family)
MVYQEKFGDDEEGKQLVYDLRQVYAIKVLSQTLQQIKFYRTQNKYSEWFESLSRDLRTEISKELDEDELKEINKKIKEILQIIKDNEMAYLGNSEDPDEHYKIKEALCELEMLLLGLMQEHKMFGSKEDDEGL